VREERGEGWIVCRLMDLAVLRDYLGKTETKLIVAA
jgi:hypothetical protein